VFMCVCVCMRVCVCVCMRVCVCICAHHLHGTGFARKNTRSDSSGLKLCSRVVVEHNMS